MKSIIFYWDFLQYIIKKRCEQKTWQIMSPKNKQNNNLLKGNTIFVCWNGVVTLWRTDIPSLILINFVGSWDDFHKNTSQFEIGYLLFTSVLGLVHFPICAFVGDVFAAVRWSTGMLTHTIQEKIQKKFQESVLKCRHLGR